MQDFSRTDPDSMNYALLAQRVRYFQDDREGVQTVSKIFEDYGKEITKEILLTSIKALMQNLNFTIEQAMEALNVPAEDRTDITSKIVTL